MKISYLDVDDLVSLAEQLLGTPAPIRDLGLLGSAAARPQTNAFGEDAYTDIWTKAASLLHSIVNNHPLIDGNKRLGWLAGGFRWSARQLECRSGLRWPSCGFVGGWC